MTDMVSKTLAIFGFLMAAVSTMALFTPFVEGVSPHDGMKYYMFVTALGTVSIAMLVSAIVVRVAFGTITAESAKSYSNPL